MEVQNNAAVKQMRETVEALVKSMKAEVKKNESWRSSLEHTCTDKIEALRQTLDWVTKRYSKTKVPTTGELGEVPTVEVEELKQRCEQLRVECAAEQAGRALAERRAEALSQLMDRLFQQ